MVIKALFCCSSELQTHRIFTFTVCQPVDGEQDWSETLLLSEDRLEEDPQSNQSQVEQKMIGQNTCGNVPWGLLTFIICKYKSYCSC